MTDNPQPQEGYVTKTGRVITPDELEALADEAERGYDVNDLPRRATTEQVVYVKPDGSSQAKVALTLAIFGASFGLIPILGMFFGLPCGIVAMILGFNSRSTLRKSGASTKMATAAVLFGVIAIALAIISTVIVQVALNNLHNDLNNP
jgi:hypothetical protein